MTLENPIGPKAKQAGITVDPEKLRESLHPALVEQLDAGAATLQGAIATEDAPEEAPAPPPVEPVTSDKANGASSVSRISASLDLAAEQLVRKQTGTMQRMWEQSSLPGKAAIMNRAASMGAGKALIETYDFVFGEPEEQDKTQWRQNVERQAKALDRSSAVNAMTGDVAQFVTGMVGLGKITAPLKALKPIKGAAKLIEGSKKATAIAESAKAASVGSVVFDPYEERIGNLIKGLPGMEDSILAYTAASPDDSSAEGRLKSALESVGIDAVAGLALVTALKAAKYARAGDQAKADALFAEAEKALPADKGQWLNSPVASSTEGVATGTLQGQHAPLEQSAMSTSGAAKGSLSGAAPDRPQPGAGVPIKIEGMQGSAQAGARGPGITIDLAAGSKANDLTTGGETTGKQLPMWTAGKGAPEEVYGFSMKGASEAEQSALRNSNGSGGAASVKQADAVQSAREVVGEGRTSVNLAPSVKFTNKDVARLLDQHEADMATIAKFGSRDAAQAAGHVFTDSHVPWSRLAGTEDLRSFIDQVAQVKLEEIGTAKGGAILRDATLMQQVRQQVSIFGEDPAVVLSNLARAGQDAPAMAATMMAGKAVTMKVLDDAYQLSRLIRSGAAKDRQESMMQLKRLLGIGAEALANTQSVRANAARTTRAGRFGIAAGDLDLLNKLDGEALIEALYASRGNPSLLVDVAKPSFWSRFRANAEKTWTHLFTNNLLWWYPTHAVNITTNVALLGMRSLEKQIGGSFIKGPGGRAIRKQAAFEYHYTLSSISDGFEMAVEAFRRGDSVLNPHDMESFANAGASGGTLKLKPVQNLADVIAYAQFATGLPTRSLGAMDEFSKTIRYRSVVQAKAAVEAGERGLKGQAFKDHIADRLREAYDETGAALDAEALMEARIATFNDPLEGRFGQTLQGAVAAMPWMRVIVPFVRTPLKVLGYGIRMTPGLQFFHARFRESFMGKHGVEAQAQAYGQMALGGLATMAAMTLAGNGMMTGAGPENKAMREYLTSKGWKPYSLILENDDGTKTYVPIGRLDPLGLVMGIAADIVDISSHSDRMEEGQNLFSMLAIAVAKNVTNKTFLLGLQNFTRAVVDPEMNAAKWLGNIGEATIPFSSLIKGLNNDDLLREARTMTDAALDRMPGFSQTLAPRYDVLSEPQLVRKGLWSSGSWDDLDDELARLNTETGKGLSAVSPDMNGEDLRDVKLADGRTGYQAVNEAISKAGIRKHLAAIVKSPTYQAAPDGQSTEQIGSKLWMLATQASKFRNLVKKRVIATHPELTKAYMKRKQHALGAISLKRMEDEAAKKGVQQSVVGKALDALGIQTQN